MELFRKMILEAPDLFPNSMTMVSVLQACAALAALEQGKFIHVYILRRGLDSTLPVMSSLITMYARCGKLDLGQQIFNMIKRRMLFMEFLDFKLWNSWIWKEGNSNF